MKKKLTNKGELTTELLALVNDGDVKDIINLNAASLEKHMEELCTACMLAADTEASQILLDGIAEKSDSFQPRSRQLIANAYEYFDIMRQKGGWRPITMQCDDADTNVEHFPHGVYPEPIEVYLRRTAEVNQTAPEMPLCIALAAFAFALQGAVKISYPSGNGHTEHLCLYMAVIAEPSERKSSSFSMTIRKAFRSWEKKAETEYQNRLSEFKGMEKSALSAISSAVRSGDERTITQVQKDYDRLKEPDSPQMLLDDTTPEALGNRMKKTGGRAGVFSDEGGFLETLAGRYSESRANIDLVLKGYSGEYASIARITRDDLTLPRPLLTICLALQPVLWERFCTDSSLSLRGLVPRFIFCRPAPMAGSRNANITAVIDADSEELYCRYIDEFLSLPRPDDDDVPVIQWEDDAAEIMLEYLQKLESEQREGGCLWHDKAYAGKASGVVLRIAGILHMLRTRNPDILLSSETASAAVKVHMFFLSEKLREQASSAKTVRSAADHALDSLKKICLSECRPYASKRELQRSLNGCTSDDLTDVLDYLADCQCVELVRASRSSVRVYPSPFLFL